MKDIVSVGLIFLGALFFMTKPALARERVKSDFKRIDTNHDRRLNRIEWNRRGNFDRLDRNHDGELSLKEVRRMYAGQNKKEYRWPPKNMVVRQPEFDDSVKKDIISRDALKPETLCGIGRGKQCRTSDAVKLGLLATGMGPIFPEQAKCLGIDDYWALDYSFKRNRTSYHGGIDIPARWGTPMIAAAAGSVVAMYQGNNSARGIELMLRHSPEDTGLPFWTYTQYGHLDQMPDLKIGQRVYRGQILGPTGNSGVSGKKIGKIRTQSSSRRPAIHFAVYFSKSRYYANTGFVIVPEKGRWMDPLAFYRQRPPFDSQSARTLPDAEKGVAVPVMLEDGTAFPKDTKLVWPYMCREML